VAEPRIADASEGHLRAIASIYGPVVTSSAATFDLEPPPIEHWRRLLTASDPDAGHFMLVAEADAGEVLGYALSTTYMQRAAYDSTCQTAVYVAADARGRGVGTALYRRLFELLDASPLRLAVAGITEPNEASTALHLAFGFERVGTFEGVGVKFGRDWSVTWYQRPLVSGSRAGGPGSRPP
jgi:phosphinothricin acetyltransferase